MTVVTEDALLDLVREAVCLVLSVPLEQVTADTRMVTDLAADSLAMIEIVEVSEERLRAHGRAVWVDDATLAALDLVTDLVGALSAATATAGEAR